MRHPCPCCGHLTFTEAPGSYDVCPVCYWEDDAVQLRSPMSSNGANTISLTEAQRSYQRIGAMDAEFRGSVRQPRQDEPVEPGWRPFDPEVDRSNPEPAGAVRPGDDEALYYWRSTHWRGDRHAEEWSELVRTARGQPVQVVEERLRALDLHHARDPEAELHIALTARVLADSRWLYKHPLAALRLAWAFRRLRSPLRTLRWLRRPRFAG